MAAQPMDLAMAERLAWLSLLRVVICPRCEDTAIRRNAAGHLTCVRCQRLIVDGSQAVGEDGRLARREVMNKG